MTDGQTVPWALVRSEYEAAGTTRNAICTKYGITLRQLMTRAETNKWVREDDLDVTDRRLLINQMLTLLERQMNQLEKTVNDTGDKEAAALSKLVQNLEKLIAMDKAEAGHTTPDTETREMRDIRAKLAKRINALTKE